MQTLLTHKMVSMTELREPAKVIDQADGKPVAIMSRNQLVGYFVPVAAVEKLEFADATEVELATVLRQRRPAIQATLKYLEDK